MFWFQKCLKIFKAKFKNDQIPIWKMEIKFRKLNEQFGLFHWNWNEKDKKKNSKKRQKQLRTLKSKKQNFKKNLQDKNFFETNETFFLFTFFKKKRLVLMRRSQNSPYFNLFIL